MKEYSAPTVEVIELRIREDILYSDDDFDTDEWNDHGTDAISGTYDYDIDVDDDTIPDDY